MKYRGDEQLDKRAATMVEHLMGSKVMLREPAGEPWGEGARRRASIWFYPLGLRISAPWAPILIYHSDILLRGGPSVRFLKAIGIYIPPLIEEALCVHESLRGSTITTYRKNEPRRTPVLPCQGLMYRSTYSAYKGFMKTITIAAIGFVRYFKGGDIFHRDTQLFANGRSLKYFSASPPNARRQKGAKKKREL